MRIHHIFNQGESMKFHLTVLFSLAASLFLSSIAAAKPLYSTKDHLYELRARDIARRSPKQVHEQNKQHYLEFIKFDVDKISGDREEGQMKPKVISLREARGVHMQASINPVVSLASYHKYDPNDRGIGFCFGRAMFVNVMLQYLKLDRDSIKKAFVVGPMDTGTGTTWGWHVTTIAQSKDENGRERWLAIDPITGVKSLWAWYEEMRKNYSTDGRLKLYITYAGKFGPSPGNYDEIGLKNPFYNKYFKDMMSWFEAESKAGRLYSIPEARERRANRG